MERLIIDEFLVPNKTFVGTPKAYDYLKKQLAVQKLSQEQRDSLEIMEQIYSQSLQESALSRLESLLSTLAELRKIRAILSQMSRSSSHLKTIYLNHYFSVQERLDALLGQGIAESFERKTYLQRVPYWHYTQEEKMNLELKSMQRTREELPIMITPTMVQHVLDTAKHQLEPTPLK